MTCFEPQKRHFLCSKAFNSRKPYSVRAAAFFSTRFVHYARVFLAADAVRNPGLTQIRQPFIVNEFPVGIAGFYMDFGKGLTGKFQQNYSFACVGVPFLSSVSHSSGIATPRQTMASTRMLIQDLPYSHVVRSRVRRTFCQLKTGNTFFARTLPSGQDRHTQDGYFIF